MISLQALIDEALQKEEESKKDRIRSGKFSPSLFGRCIRFQYWSRKNEPISDPLDARTLRKFKVGKIFHEFVEELLPNHETEVLVEIDDVKGYADVVLDDAVIDIKSCHTYDFKRFWDKKKAYNCLEDKKTYWLQVCYYAMQLKKEKCGLFFIGKDDLVTEQFYYFTAKLAPMVEEELSMLREAWKHPEPPKGSPRAYGGKECGYCCYRSKCEYSTVKEDK